MKPPISGHRRLRLQQGSVLVGVLWCVALLFVMVVGVLHTARIDLIVTRNYQDRIQAHFLAVAGVEKAKALIYHDARERSRNRKPQSSTLYNSPELFREIKVGRGVARVVRRGGSFEGDRVVFGVSDEEGRLNLNQASAAELSKLYGMTPDVLAAILDWRDKDNEPSPGGAELDYYTSLAPPRRPRNAPFETVRELLMVRGVTKQALFGAAEQEDNLPEDLNHAEASVGTEDPAAWAGILTVHSSVNNLSSAGIDRVNVQTADERTLATVPGITAEIARAIVAYRGQQRLESVVDLLQVTAQSSDPAAQAGANNLGSASRPQSAQPSPLRAGAPQPGPRVISPNLLMDIADDITTSEDKELPGVLNVNSASLEALVCLPGLSRESAQGIISFRESNGYLPNIAWLLKVQGISPEILRQLAPRICTRSETYRIRCEGMVNSSGTRQRIEEVVHIGLKGLTTLEYREVDL